VPAKEDSKGEDKEHPEGGHVDRGIVHGLHEESSGTERDRKEGAPAEYSVLVDLVKNEVEGNDEENETGQKE
jgi:hypothetical protein